MLYFIPGSKSPDDALIQEFNLEYAFENLPREVGQCLPGRGPNNQSGFILSCSGETPDFQPTRQVWHNHLNGVMFGWSTRPTPNQLRRESLIDGNLVKLSDGNPWQIPMAQSFLDQAGSIRYVERFARTLEFRDGEWVAGRIIPAHESFANIGKIVFDAWRSASNGRFDIPDATNLCCKAICCNYRLSAIEVGALGLLTNHEDYVWSILRQVIDMDGYLDLQKKILEEQSTSSGSRE